MEYQYDHDAVVRDLKLYKIVSNFWRHLKGHNFETISARVYICSKLFLLFSPPSSQNKLGESCNLNRLPY